jgi:hypothetical protein
VNLHTKNPEVRKRVYMAVSHLSCTC